MLPLPACGSWYSSGRAVWGIEKRAPSSARARESRIMNKDNPPSASLRSAMRRQIPGHGLGQPLDRVLGGAIDRSARGPDMAHLGRHVDDRAAVAPLDHDFGHRLRDHEGCANVQVSAASSVKVPLSKTALRRGFWKGQLSPPPARSARPHSAGSRRRAGSGAQRARPSCRRPR